MQPTGLVTTQHRCETRHLPSTPNLTRPGPRPRSNRSPTSPGPPPCRNTSPKTVCRCRNSGPGPVWTRVLPSPTAGTTGSDPRGRTPFPKRVWPTLSARTGFEVLGAVHSGFLLLAGEWVAGLHIGDHPAAAALVTALFTRIAASLGVLIASVVTRKDRVPGLCLLLALPMAAPGGCWLPLEIAPDVLRHAAFLPAHRLRRPGPASAHQLRVTPFPTSCLTFLCSPVSSPSHKSLPSDIFGSDSSFRPKQTVF